MEASPSLLIISSKWLLKVAGLRYITLQQKDLAQNIENIAGQWSFFFCSQSFANSSYMSFNHLEQNHFRRTLKLDFLMALHLHSPDLNIGRGSTKNFEIKEIGAGRLAGD